MATESICSTCLGASPPPPTSSLCREGGLVISYPFGCHPQRALL